MPASAPSDACQRKNRRYLQNLLRQSGRENNRLTTLILNRGTRIPKQIAAGSLPPQQPRCGVDQNLVCAPKRTNCSLS